MSDRCCGSGETYELKGKKVTVVGLGRFSGGVGVTRWLCREGAKVTVSGPASVRAGGRFSYRVSLSADRAGERVVRVNVYDPDGIYHDLYSKDIRVEGRVHRDVIPMALNDTKGTWRLEAIDVGSQVRSEKAFEVK